MKLSNFRKSRVQSQSRALIKSKSIYDKRVSSMSFLHYLIFAIFVICLKYPNFLKICMIKARFLCIAYIRSEVIFKKSSNLYYDHLNLGVCYPLERKSERDCVSRMDGIPTFLLEFWIHFLEPSIFGIFLVV